jgi:heat-inducible transcriptional repressor
VLKSEVKKKMSELGKELSPRKKQILKAVVEAHIAAGEPVGSKFLVQSNLLTCSSATIRNEMAELEEMGYLEQPHTSAGRVPSELGYRFYVDSLRQHYAMTSNEI